MVWLSADFAAAPVNADHPFGVGILTSLSQGLGSEHWGGATMCTGFTGVSRGFMNHAPSTSALDSDCQLLQVTGNLSRTYTLLPTVCCGISVGPAAPHMALRRLWDHMADPTLWRYVFPLRGFSEIVFPFVFMNRKPKVSRGDSLGSHTLPHFGDSTLSPHWSGKCWG